MKIVKDYLQLRKSFPDAATGEAFHVTMNELANALFCTNRNAKYILTKMEELDWIRFTSGRGRGNWSELTLLRNERELLRDYAQELVHKGALEEALQTVKEYGNDSIHKEDFLEWLFQNFGYSVDDCNDAYIETLRLPVYRTINTLDPAESFYALDSHMVDQIFNTLVHYDVDRNEYVGEIAHHWKCNPEGTQWTFYLRKGIQFHHGGELTSEDVQFSLLRLKERKYAQSWLVKDIEGIHIQSRYSLQITLNRPNYLFLTFLSYPPTSILPKEIYIERSDVESGHFTPVGSGPYKVTKRTPELYVLESFDRFFLGRALIDRIEIYLFPENHNDIQGKLNNNMLMVQTGESAYQSPSENWNESHKLTGCSVLTINQSRDGILKNKLFRKALYHLVDRKSMIQTLGVPRLFPAHSFKLDSIPSDLENKYSSREAEDWLEQSGYKGEPIFLYTYQRHALDAFWLKNAYAQYGINIEVEIVPWADMLLEDHIVKADLILFEAVLSEGIIRKIENYQSFFIRRHLEYDMARFVDLEIDKMLACPDAGIREQIMQVIEEKLKEEVALIFLVYKSVNTQSTPSLQGVRVNSRGWVDFKNVWVESYNNGESKRAP